MFWSWSWPYCILEEFPGEEQVSSEPAYPIKAGKGWQEPLNDRERTLKTPIVISRSRPDLSNYFCRISTFDVSDVPLLDIHKFTQI
ncbi:hypothetical protein J6590_094810 [Homalodisca vitripennis]|nr:hypothetical protein J6590_093519 [Homalodisca vitripennis]KAG8309076.1 hypothetical protein J6590_094810 [Homalodisca vitripennis]